MVAVTECCYGRGSPTPSRAAGILRICNTYLASGAIAFFGSTTAAYGGHNIIAWADALCGFFLYRLLDGQASGDAVRDARLDFVEHLDDDMIKDKTLAQFGLMGDPSLQPFTAPDVKAIPAKLKGHVLPVARPPIPRLDQRTAAAARVAEYKKLRSGEPSADRRRRCSLGHPEDPESRGRDRLGGS